MTAIVLGHLAGGLVDIDRVALTWLHQLEQRQNMAVNIVCGILSLEVLYTL